tara:strand:+ start:1007 stop:1315 length:309 start_codon:yes stop_codon:yes gene_type:complete
MTYSLEDLPLPIYDNWEKDFPDNHCIMMTKLKNGELKSLQINYNSNLFFWKLEYGKPIMITIDGKKYYQLPSLVSCGECFDYLNLNYEPWYGNNKLVKYIYD